MPEALPRAQGHFKSFESCRNLEPKGQKSLYIQFTYHGKEKLAAKKGLVLAQGHMEEALSRTLIPDSPFHNPLQYSHI